MDGDEGMEISVEGDANPLLGRCPIQNRSIGGLGQPDVPTAAWRTAAVERGKS
jgi:hypothetical protein